MSTVAELRAKIKSGAVKPSQGGTSKVGEGTFIVAVREGEYKKGESGNLRGMIKVMVRDELSAEGVALDASEAEGGTFNLFVQTKNEKYLEQDIALWQEILVANGISEDKIYDDADDLVDIAGNILTYVNKLAIKNKLFLVVSRKAQANKDSKGNIQYWNNIDIAKSLELVGTMESGPVTLDAEALTAGLSGEKVAPVATPTAEVKPAPVQEAVAPVVATKKKAWQR
jgi:hypothetical protein